MSSHVVSTIRTWIRLAGCAAAVAAAVAAQQNEELTPRDKEVLRLQRIVAYAKKNNATPKEIFQAVHAPLAAANMKDIERNLALSERFLERSEEAGKKMKEKDAEKYAFVSRLLEEYAKQNKSVVNAIKDTDQKKLNEAFATIRKIEARIEQLTGQKYKRDWFMPEELQVPNTTPQVVQ